MIIYVKVAPGAYELSGSVIGTNGDIEISKGEVLTFKLDVAGHPFWIKTKEGTGQDNAVSSGISGVGQGETSGVLIWDTARIEEGTYYYQCGQHPSMIGSVVVSSAPGGSGAVIVGGINYMVVALSFVYHL